MSEGDLQEKPTAPKPAVAAPKGPVKSMQQLEVDRTKVENLWFTRREFLSLAAWGTFLAGLAGSALAVLRFFIPNITYDPPSSFKIGKPEEYLPGEVTERWKKKYRIWVARDSEAEGGGIYAIFARCTHLGCTPNWLEGQRKFKCPCHGSGFRKTGINFEGPAPRPLERCRITLADDGQILVDTANRFKNPKDWRKPDVYLKV
ncbi:MAG: Rieske 2Fe-2S domain-containing protein [Candidatus Omnitrophica bacterium]|nr:Rieske 2Fe-2S domain-containing protein [Candidatus Omnitrophota bacterium]